MQKPKVGEVYRTLTFQRIIKVVETPDTTPHIVHYVFLRESGKWESKKYKQQWDWTKFHCDKLTPLELELL
jgi:hypothetical protein